jgi:hypothetical protein
MAVRTALRVRVPHVHGTLLHVIEELGRARIHVDALAALAAGAETIIELLPRDPQRAQQALQQAGLDVEAVQVAVAWVPNDPNALVRATQAVVLSGLTIDGFYVISSDGVRGQQVAIECADAQRADQLLWALTY